MVKGAITMRNATLRAAVAVLVGFFALSAKAADMPMKAVPYASAGYEWTGFYVGGYMGDGFSSFPLSFSGANVQTQQLLGNLGPGSLGPGQSALLAGGFLGFNYQTGSVVWGVEFQGGFTGFNNQQSMALGVVQTQSSIPWDLAILGRLGFTPTQRVLIYAVGGLEAAEIDHNGSCTLIATCVVSSDSNVHWGPTGGVGVEWAPEALGRLRVGLEYRYVSVGNSTINLTVPNTTLVGTSTDKAAWNQVVARVTYPF
jgi:outer membrane immunogenic protein